MYLDVLVRSRPTLTNEFTLPTGMIIYRLHPYYVPAGVTWLRGKQFTCWPA